MAASPVTGQSIKKATLKRLHKTNKSTSEMSWSWSDPRKTHIWRLFGKSSKGEEKEIWVDVERVDSIPLVWGNEGQVREHKLEWYNTHGREVTTLKLTDPSNPDADYWIEIDVIDRIYFEDDTGQKSNIKFDNTTSNRKREVVACRVIHWDTSVEDALNNGEKVDDSPLASSDGYKFNDNNYPRTEGTEDDGNYIDVEVCTKFLAGLSHDPQNDDTAGQKSNYKFQNKYLIDRLNLAPEDSKPVRLDPFQNIVNVNWGSEVYAVFLFMWSINPVEIDILNDSNGKPKATVVLDKTGDHFRMYVVKVKSRSGEFIRFNCKVPSYNAGLGTPVDYGVDIRSWLMPISFDVHTLSFFDIYLVDPDKTPFPCIWFIEVFRVFNSCAVTFAIQRKNHLTSEKNTVPLTEMWVATGINQSTYYGFTSIMNSYHVAAYRTDKEGTGTLYGQPPEWAVPIVMDSEGHLYYALRIGSPPPPIAVDVPFKAV